MELFNHFNLNIWDMLFTIAVFLVSFAWGFYAARSLYKFEQKIFIAEHNEAVKKKMDESDTVQCKKAEILVDYI
jgi:hypothetical protein